MVVYKGLQATVVCGLRRGAQASDLNHQMIALSAQFVVWSVRNGIR